MKSTIIIKIRGDGYVATASGKFGGGFQGARIGLTPHEAATRAAELMLQYSATNTEGGELMAPAEVLDLVPEHLRKIAASEK